MLSEGPCLNLQANMQICFIPFKQKTCGCFQNIYALNKYLFATSWMVELRDFLRDKEWDSRDRGCISKCLALSKCPTGKRSRKRSHCEKATWAHAQGQALMFSPQNTYAIAFSKHQGFNLHRGFLLRYTFTQLKLFHI